MLISFLSYQKEYHNKYSHPLDCSKLFRFCVCSSCFSSTSYSVFARPVFPLRRILCLLVLFSQYVVFPLHSRLQSKEPPNRRRELNANRYKTVLPTIYATGAGAPVILTNQTSKPPTVGHKTLHNFTTSPPDKIPSVCSDVATTPFVRNVPQTFHARTLSQMDLYISFHLSI